ncbi:hypothetical protein KQI82_05800 [Oscillibacter sp. MSJ-2]|uniref:Uncharacterized protein n=1 Tax=Dysosmobacter acutus TaxID=2841504 RepID=A0ABS6F8Q9_9FIRM|nr:hypothetical protein [Dysosmobacter acutus]MBU5626435.1 hypothetical protein [Dysosmobacter acutus]
MRKHTLWRVPAYCAAAGVVSRQLIIRWLGRLAVVTLPDGVVSIDLTRQLIVYGIVFLAALSVGAMILRSMTRKEIALSATIIVAFQLALAAFELAAGGMTESLGTALWYLSQSSEWSHFLSQLLFKAGGMDFLWAGVFLDGLAPYLFILFGRKDGGQTAE